MRILGNNRKEQRAAAAAAADEICCVVGRGESSEGRNETECRLRVRHGLKKDSASFVKGTAVNRYQSDVSVCVGPAADVDVRIRQQFTALTVSDTGPVSAVHSTVSDTGPLSAVS